MTTLLVYDRGKWSRHPLPGTGCVQVRADADATIRIEPVQDTSFAPDAVGVLVICAGGHPHHLAVPGKAAYLNAEPRPITPVHRLRDGDRLTYHVADGPSFCAWWLRRDGQAKQRYDGTPLGQACGYCSMDFVLGEEMVACSRCQWSVHADCLAHGGGKCPHCGLDLAGDDKPWLPEGFPDGAEEADDGWE